MTIEILLLSIEGSLAIGVAVGLLLGISDPKPKLGCVLLLAVPVAMVVFVSWWQGQHPENLRSTSGLDFVFAPLWPSIGATGGHFAGKWLRSLFDKPI
ncbi:MAG: hypothetical protein EOP60_03340 [Sphingomonadales bacterium]|nr:MAG: hypothetical protein EOP60_03340 [Sphingomonadales bacterium]